MKRLLVLISLATRFALHAKRPGGGDSPGSTPDPSKQPSQKSQSGSINAGDGVTSAQDATGLQATLGEPAGADGQPGTTPTPTPGSAPLPRPPQPGRTHGRWTDPDGNVVPLQSGRGEYYDAARARAVELGLTRGHPNAEAAIARHLEIQFVERMRALGIQHAEIEINRPVCGTTPRDQQWPDTCDRQLPRFLPPGWTLVVKDGSSPEGRTYVGEG